MRVNYGVLEQNGWRALPPDITFVSDGILKDPATVFEPVERQDVDSPSSELPATVTEGLPLTTADDSEHDTPLKRPGFEAAGEITKAMRRTAPKSDSAYYDQLLQAYHQGMIVAAYRRANPVAAPQAWTPDVSHLPKPETYEDTELISMISGVKGLPRVALPVVEMIRDEMPDVVFGCDRGGRMIANAVHADWRALYPSTPFPSIDSAIHFGRISKSNDTEVTKALVLHMMYRSGAMAEMAQRKAEHDSRPLTVALLDDWVIGGGTIQLGRDAIETALKDARLNDCIRLVVGTMKPESSTDAADRQVDGTRLDYWDSYFGDDSDSLGIDYGLNYHRAASRTIVPRVVRSENSRAQLRDLHKATAQMILPSPHVYTRLAPTPAIESKSARQVSAGNMISRLLRLKKALSDNILS